MQHEGTRQRPQHLDERREQQRILHQADPQIRRQLGQVARILVHALIRIDADLAGALQAKRASRRHPIHHQILDQSLSQLQFQGFTEPALRDVQHQERARDDAEYPELDQELVQIAVGKGVVEGLVPAIEADLAVSRGGDDAEYAERQHEERIAHRGCPKRTAHHVHLRPQAGLSDLLQVGGGSA